MPSTAPIQPGFIVLQGNRLEDLREVALQWLAHQPLAPLEDETLLVQSNGIAEWLQMSMAAYPDDADQVAGQGIAFGVHTLLPAQFQWQVYSQVLADAGQTLPRQSPFDKPHLRWRLMRLLPQLLDQEAFAPLQHYLGDDPDQRKRFQLAERLADLLDQYQVYRADWLNAWAREQDICPRLPGGDTRLPAEQRWQAALWRAILADMPDAQRQAHRAAIHETCLQHAKSLTPATRPRGLPRRVVVFGISALPQQTLQVLGAVSHLSQIVLCLVNPCQHYWGELIEGRELLRQEVKRLQRKQDMPTELAPELLHLHGHPLLAAWGKQGRDYLHLVAEHDQSEQHAAAFHAERLDIDLFKAPDTTRLLGQLQDDILELRPLAETRALWSKVDARQDPSLVFHVAHSPLREVEILHDQLLDAFARDANLRPRDVIVMVPDIHKFAPAIQAVFGQYDREDDRHIPFHVTDQKRRHQQPLLVALETLLKLPQLRFRTGEVLDLLQVPALQHRFGLDPTDLPTLQRWIEESGIRWGLHADQRRDLGAELGLEAAGDAHGWRFGLERMLLGYAIGESELGAPDWDGVVPYAEVAGLNAASAGPLYRLIDALDASRQRLQATHTPRAWARELRALLERFFVASTPLEDRLLGQLGETLDDWLLQCEEADFQEPLPLTVVREHWLATMDENRLTQRFFGGAVTFATLLPMRAIPFRHVCLLGMNDADYPRQSVRQDFDLMADPGQYRPGDRSRREDDRYLFLEALLSARNCLYISWTGRNVRDNSELTPSVLVGQLRDHLAAGWRLRSADLQTADHADSSQPERDSGAALLTALTTLHPLQPFSHDYFQASAQEDATLDHATRIARSRRFTHAREWQGIHARTDLPGVPDPALERLPPWVPEGPLNLQQLRQCLRAPIHVLFHERLGVRFNHDAEVMLEAEPFGMASGLDVWQQIESVLGPVAARLARQPDADPDALIAELTDRHQRAGQYPPGPFGKLQARDLATTTHSTLERLAASLRQYPHVLEPAARAEHQWQTRLNDATWHLAVEDTIAQVHCNASGDCLRIVPDSSVLGRNLEQLRWHVLARHWPTHLALQLACPQTDTRITGRDCDQTLAGMPRARACELLDQLLASWFAAAQRPIPLTAELGCSLAVAACAAQTAEAQDAAQALDLQHLFHDKKVAQALENALAQTPALGRVCAGPETLQAWPNLVDDALALYQPLIDHVLAQQEDAP